MTTDDRRDRSIGSQLVEDQLPIELAKSVVRA